MTDNYKDLLLKLHYIEDEITWQRRVLSNGATSLDRDRAQEKLNKLELSRAKLLDEIPDAKSKYHTIQMLVIIALIMVSLGALGFYLL